MRKTHYHHHFHLVQSIFGSGVFQFHIVALFFTQRQLLERNKTNKHILTIKKEEQHCATCWVLISNSENENDYAFRLNCTVSIFNMFIFRRTHNNNKKLLHFVLISINFIQQQQQHKKKSFLSIWQIKPFSMPRNNNYKCSFNISWSQNVALLFVRIYFVPRFVIRLARRMNRK